MKATVEEHLRVRFQCSVCSRSWSSRKKAQAHVARCAGDPDARACKTCKHDWFETGHDAMPVCGIDARPEGVLLAFNCESWERA